MNICIPNRRILLLAFASLVATPALAEDWPSEPRDIVAKIYAISACKSGKYDCPSAFSDRQVRARYFSKSLMQLVDRSEAKSKRRNEPGIDFDPVMNTQEEAQPRDMAFTVDSAAPDKTVVSASWRDFGDVRMKVTYDFVQEGGGWKIFDMRGLANGKNAWSLRKVAAGG